MVLPTRFDRLTDPQARGARGRFPSMGSAFFHVQESGNGIRQVSGRRAESAGQGGQRGGGQHWEGRRSDDAEHGRHAEACGASVAAGHQVRDERSAVTCPSDLDGTASSAGPRRVSTSTGVGRWMRRRILRRVLRTPPPSLRGTRRSLRPPAPCEDAGNPGPWPTSPPSPRVSAPNERGAARHAPRISTCRTLVGRWTVGWWIAPLGSTTRGERRAK